MHEYQMTRLWVVLHFIFYLLQAHIRWGAECRSYDMSMKADVGQLSDSKPVLRAKAHWTMIPEYMTEMGKR